MIHTNRDNSGKLDNLFGNRYHFDSDWNGVRRKIIKIKYPIEEEF